ncbi:P2Y purinoceptor 4 [Brachyhypopomus gauderio]|uniref:P2Y purinoceptor 4 n=1 Tax=Brachyhypopomus gauderio TaxID=698409 RepID=UPI004042A560
MQQTALKPMDHHSQRGLLTNGVAIRQLCGFEKTATVIFTLNIMVSDVLVCCSFLFRAAFYRGATNWMAASVLCNASEFLTFSCFYINLYCNMGFLLWISINRYSVVVQPHSRLLQAFQRPRQCWVICLATWTLGATVVCPSIGHKVKRGSAANKTNSCFDQVFNTAPEELKGVHAVGAGVFFVSLALMLLSYGLLIIHLQKVREQSLVGAGLRAGGGLRVRRKILASVLLFTACFLPHHVQRVRMTRDGRSCRETQADVRVKTLTVLVAALSCCLHPALHLLLRLPCCRAQHNVRAPPKPEGSLTLVTAGKHT